MALKKKYKFLITLLLIIAVGVLFYTFFVQIRHVKAGEIGVKASLGSPIDNGVDYDIRTVKGYIVFMPLYTDFVTYPTTIQVTTYDDIAISTQDGMQFHLKPSISYQVNEAKAIQLYKSNRSLSVLNNGYLKEIVTASYAAVANSFSADSLVMNKQQFETLVNTTLVIKMNDIGLELKNITSNMKYPEIIENAISLRAQALQDALVTESKLREIEAQSREDSIRFSVLTPLAIQKMYIEKWDGKMPAYGGEIYRIHDSISKNK